MVDSTGAAGLAFTYVEYVSYFLAANASVAGSELPSQFKRIIFRANFIAFGAVACGTVVARASLAFAESQLLCMAESYRRGSNSYKLLMMAYGGRACMTLGAAGYGASIGNRFAKLIFWQ